MKIAIVRSDLPLTIEQEEQARQRVAKQLPSDWTVLYLPSRTSAEFLETVPNAKPSIQAVKCLPQVGESEIVRKPVYMSMNKPVESAFLKAAMQSIKTTASMVGCTVSGRQHGAPPKITRDGVETGESIVEYREWLMRTPGAQCDHEFIGERIPGGMLSCVYCRKPKCIP
ncbi:MAG: hypothetical protein V4641_16210 [Pseudomonadota bacterium]